MKTYLRVVNPIVAALVVLLCVWAAMNGDDGFKPMGMFRGWIPTYFLAKGLFCGSVLVLMGKIVELMVNKTRGK